MDPWQRAKNKKRNGKTSKVPIFYHNTVSLDGTSWIENIKIMDEIGEASVPINEKSKLIKGGAADQSKDASRVPGAVFSSLSFNSETIIDENERDCCASTRNSCSKICKRIPGTLCNSVIWGSVIIGFLAASIVLIGNGNIFERIEQPSWQSDDQEKVWNLFWGKESGETVTNKPLHVYGKSKKHNSGSKLVIAGKMNVIDGPCNIAEYDLHMMEWSLKERIQLSSYKSYSGGEVYYLLANHTSPSVPHSSVEGNQYDDDSRSR